MHKHRCPRCFYIWEHNDTCAWIDEYIFETSHTCPRCNTHDVVDKYFGVTTPSVTQRCNPSGVVYDYSSR
jgi:hypothetical protein